MMYAHIEAATAILAIARKSDEWFVEPGFQKAVGQPRASIEDAGVRNTKILTDKLAVLTTEEAVELSRIIGKVLRA